MAPEERNNIREHRPSSRVIWYFKLLKNLAKLMLHFVLSIRKFVAAFVTRFFWFFVAMFAVLFINIPLDYYNSLEPSSSYVVLDFYDVIYILLPSALLSFFLVSNFMITDDKKRSIFISIAKFSLATIFVFRNFKNFITNSGYRNSVVRKIYLNNFYTVLFSVASGGLVACVVCYLLFIVNDKRREELINPVLIITMSALAALVKFVRQFHVHL